MVVVALAGSGNISKQIIAALLAASPRKHTAIVLSRNPQPTLSASGIEVRIVDYNSPASLTTALSGVHTVISTLSPSYLSTLDPTADWRPEVSAYVAPQLALLSAAQAAGVRRFSPTALEANHHSLEICDVYRVKNQVWDAVRASGLEYTAFRPGIFMNYLAHGSTVPGMAEEVFDGLPAFPVVVDIAKRTADIPGTGDTRLGLTLTQDVGRFVVAALDIPDGQWPKEAGMASWVGSFNELVSVVERVTGRKLVVKYTSKKGLEEQLEKTEALSARFGIQAALVMAEYACPEDLSLNRLTDVKPMGLEEFLKKWWL